ncbi:MAG: hypothetical protein IJP92_10970 [Lachnospiraceae bacterium]|nr:hypothetical protein [Lachnospiraceae bacterium]
MYKANKKVIGKLTKCYSVAKVEDQGKVRLLCAAEKQDPCYMFEADGTRIDTLWEGPGGVMTLEQFPCEEETIVMATRKFYSPNDSADAKIVYYTRGADGKWEMRVLCDLPFVHRFGLLTRGGRQYLIACTLKSDHAYKNDWTCPGRVWVAELPADIRRFDAEHQLPLTPLVSGLYHNHGFAKVREADGTVWALVGTDKGVLKVVPPAEAGGAWETALLLAEATSDMLYEDFDGDGKRELLVMAPFHGEKLAVFHEAGEGLAAPVFGKAAVTEVLPGTQDVKVWNGESATEISAGAKRFEKVWQYPEEMPFLHAIYPAEIRGKKLAIVGAREGKRELLALYYDPEKKDYVTDVLDAGAGPANALFFKEDGKDMVLAANRETDEIALYEITAS